MHTFCEVLDADVVKLLDLLHHQLLLVDLDDDRRVSRIPPGESEFAEGGLELLRDIDGVRLWARSIHGGRSCMSFRRHRRDVIQDERVLSAYMGYRPWLTFQIAVVV